MKVYGMRITPGFKGGKIRAVASKSDLHRKLICAAFADGNTRFSLGTSELCDDVIATIDGLKALGAEIDITGSFLTVSPAKHRARSVCVDCHESGSTLRFLLPVAAAVSENAAFSGDGRLPARPIAELSDSLCAHGKQMISKTLPIKMKGKLSAGAYPLPGDISSQYISGLLLALPLLEQSSVITLTSPLESKYYVDMTVDVLHQFGADIVTNNDSYTVVPVGKYRSPGLMETDGDWSACAVFLCAGAISGKAVSVDGLSFLSTQGDKIILDILSLFGSEIIKDGSGSVKVNAAELHGCEIDVSDIPDLLPVLAVIATCARGESVFHGVRRLRFKESDRVRAVCNMLSSLGIDSTADENTIKVYPTRLRGGTVDSFGDHRIVMAAATAAAVSDGDVTILNAGVVSKSYPGFFRDYISLGGTADVI